MPKEEKGLVENLTEALIEEFKVFAKDFSAKFILGKSAVKIMETPTPPSTQTPATPKERRKRKQGKKKSAQRISGKEQIERQKKIVDALKGLGPKSPIKKIAKRAKLDSRGVGSSLHYLSLHGFVLKNGDGTYSPKPHENVRF